MICEHISCSSVKVYRVFYIIIATTFRSKFLVYRNFGNKGTFVLVQKYILSSDFILVFALLSNSFKRCCCCICRGILTTSLATASNSAYASAIIAFVIACLHLKPSPLLKQSKHGDTRFYLFVVVVHINDHQAQRLERFLNSFLAFSRTHIPVHPKPATWRAGSYSSLVYITPFGTVR